MNSKKHIVFLGSSGFPYVKEATVTRILYLAMALKEADYQVLIINKKGRYLTSENETKLDPTGKLNGIDYVYTSGDANYSTVFLKRNINKVKGFLNEVKLLYRLKKQGKLHYAFIYTHFFSALLYYRLISKIIGFKTVINIVEYLSMIEAKKTVKAKINDKLFDTYVSCMGDGYIPISDFLVSKLRKAAKNKYLKIPPVFDYKVFDEQKTYTHTPKYFLFCGSAGYYEVIKLIVDSYRAINRTDVELYIVSNGAPHYVKRVQELIAEDKTISLFQNLSNEDLYDLYRNAHALLIPLRDTIQDTARFPNKISEYLATRNTIITTNFGEIPKYFTNNENALVADQFSVASYSKELLRSIENPELCVQIGERGYQTGKQYFSFNNYAVPLKELLDRL
jgi:glycosyltransferase involved in cell wall biosynthesis